MSTPEWPPRPVTTPEELEAAIGPALEAMRRAYDPELPSGASDEANGGERDPFVVAWRQTHGLKHGNVALVEARIVALAADERWEARALVAEVLRYLTGPYEPLATFGQLTLGDPAIARAWLLCAMANVEGDERALSAIVSAFVDLKHEVGDDAAAAFALRFVDHRDPGVRSSAVGVLNANRSAAAISALIARTRDTDSHVREWACFGLGHQLGFAHARDLVDTPELRDALAACLADPVGAVRQDAATGLALRGDERGLAAVAEWLTRFEAEGVTEGVLETLEEAPRSRFVPRLEVIAAAEPDRRSAAEALEACRQASAW